LLSRLPDDAISIEIAIANPVTTTVATTLVLLYRTIVTASVVAFAFKIIRVAGGTEGRVLGFPGGPPLHTIRTAADRRTVAAITPRIPAVITQFIFDKGTVRVMTEIGRRPAIGGMTHIALVGCVQVTVWFFSCATAVVMTTLAVVGRAGIVHPAATSEGRSGMTGDTIQIGWKMVRHGIHHTSRRITIVARNAIIRDAGMIESRWFEDARVMTDTAILIGRDMIGFLRCGKPCIVTGTAVIHYARVTESRRLKAGGLVAVDAIAVGGHMEIVFSGRRSAIVTGHTVIGDALVFKRGTGKGRGVMAQFAFVCVCVLVNIVDCVIRRSGRRSTIVAGCTVVNDAGMIEHGRFKAAASCVTDTAILGGRNMAGVHAFCRACAIGYMTGVAARGQHGRIVVVDKCIGKINRVVAQGTILGRHRMIRRIRFRPGAERGKVAIVAGSTIAVDTLVGQHRGRREPGNGMADIAILCSWHVVRILDQISAWIARQWQELTGMAAFAAVGDGIVNVRQKSYRRRKIARVGCIGGVAHNTLSQRRNMSGFLAYGPDRYIVRIAAMA